MVAVPIPPFEPDRSRFADTSSPSVINMLPVADGWAPMPGTVTVSATALPSACLGAFYARAASGTARYFVFTATKIYEFNSGTLGWTDVSRLVGGAYAAILPWSFTLFGTKLYAINGIDTEQFIDIESGTNFADNSSAPLSKYIATVGDFVVRGSVGGVPNKLQWSALNDPAGNTSGLDGSDFQLFPEGEEIMGIIPMSFGAIIALRSGFFAMNFAPSSGYVFTFQQMTKQRGTSSPYSMSVLNQDDFVIYCDDGFYRGAQFQPIGSQKVDNWIKTQTSGLLLTQMESYVDPGRKIVWFRYTLETGGYRLLGYEWDQNRWCYSDVSVQAIFKARTYSVTIDGMDAYYSTIDAGSLPIDSPVFQGGIRRLACITSDGKLGYLDGINQAASAETAEMALNGTSRAMINGGTLLSDAVSASVTLSVADYRGGTLTAKTAVTPSSRTRRLSLRGDGRVHKVRVDIAAGADWSVLSGIDLEVVGTGRS